jgi:glycosyltransferase involved in cell wall biosynthesis
LPEKNFKALEEAFKKLGKDWCMVICGEVPSYRVKALDPSGERLLCLYLSHSHMQVIYPLVDIFILPSLDEPFGIATLEAMSHRLPVLLHNNPHSVWLCGDKEQCLDMRNPQNIIEILNDEKTVKEMKDVKSIKNQRHFLENFTWEKLEKDYLKLFDLAE